MVTTHGEMEVPKVLALKGPKGTYSHCCISRADQSLSKTMTKIYSCASSTATGAPNPVSRPTINPICSSNSSRLQPEKTGGCASGTLTWPLGRWISVQLTPPELARRLYATG